MKMQTKQIIQSRLLPKTGQSTSYYNYDDGYYEKGWWKDLTLANNRTRFVSKTIDGDDVVIDNATGLMWAADGNGAGCLNGVRWNWADAIAYIGELDFAGYTDWRMPNALELVSIINFGTNMPAIYGDYFLNTKTEHYWSSTTLSPDVSSAMCVKFDFGTLFFVSKFFTWSSRSVRSL